MLIAETQSRLSRERSSADYREALAGNLDTARQMKRLAEALLELARLDGGEDSTPGEPVDLADVARETVARLGPLAAARAVEISTECDRAVASGSPERFALVISSLVENSIHHGRQGGLVRVRTWQTGGEVFASVADDGPGISAEDMPHVFERFYRADKSRTGSGGRYGLGLAICRGLVEAEGGRISVTSFPGQGTTFTVSLPKTCSVGHPPSPRP